MQIYFNKSSVFMLLLYIYIKINIMPRPKLDIKKLKLSISIDNELVTKLNEFYPNKSKYIEELIRKDFIKNNIIVK